MSSWSRTHLIELRNKAAARAQQCAAVVQEAEELTSLIEVIDQALNGPTLTLATALRELTPVDDRPKSPIRSQSAEEVLKFLQDIPGEDAGIQDVASALGMNYKTVKWALARLLKANVIERPSYGRYCYRTRSLAA